MGGNALKQAGFESTRADAKTYHNVMVPQALERLCAALPECRLAVVPAYRDKSSFGDLDLMVESDSLPHDWQARALEGLESRAHVKNGNVLSAEMLGFQVDLMVYPSTVFDFALRYFSWNDLGNFLGRVAQGMGFKFGHEGLKYKLYAPDSPTHLVSELLVTRSFDQALTFLGYDPAGHAEGFDSLEDIFGYAASGRYFHQGSFSLEHRSNKSRTRDRKRPTYMAFLRWIEKLETRSWPHIQEPDAFLTRADSAFPGFSDRRDSALEEYQSDQAFKALFNGSVMARLSGEAGAELGRKMAKVVVAAGGRTALKEALLGLTADESERVLKSFMGEEKSVS